MVCLALSVNVYDSGRQSPINCDEIRLPVGYMSMIVGPCPMVASVTKSAMPAELLRLASGALRDHDVDEGGAAEVHRLVEGAAQVLWILDKEALAAEGVHYPVIASAVNQCVGLHVEHRAFRDLRHAGADAAIVQDDDLGWEVVTDQRLHL